MDAETVDRLLCMIWYDSCPDDGCPRGMPGFGSREEIFANKARRAEFSEEQIQIFLDGQKAAKRG